MIHTKTELLKKINNGWELGCYEDKRCVVQFGGLGNGKGTQDVSKDLVDSLLEKKTIEKVIINKRLTTFILVN